MTYTLCLFFGVIFLLGSCTNNKGDDFRCAPEPMPKYEYRASISGEMTPQMDSILRIEKRREVFKPCRIYAFDAAFYSASNKLISKERILLMATGKRWEHNPEKQDEILVKYEFDKESIDSINLYQLNKSAVSDEWWQTVSTGIRENVEEIWMHPFRSNQYNFTEVAPFPQIKFPLSVGKKWNDNTITLQEGWGDWSHMKVKSTFEILSKETVQTNYGELENCWKVKAVSNFDLGQSEVTFWFHERFGFVKLNYVNYGGQKLNIELTQITEN